MKYALRILGLACWIGVMLVTDGFLDTRQCIILAALLFTIDSSAFLDGWLSRKRTYG